ncbi:MAG: A/G-specific adenine glycosylase [Myxococcales bacterium]|nr:A/G-specific adenine glycosylase [Myxococcales bacterium]
MPSGNWPRIIAFALGDNVATLEATQRQAFRRQLLRWFDRYARDLPWRHTSDPYSIWVSEIMLQQTQVVTVERYYHRFLDRFPDVQSLASASEEDVLLLWEGLGYYRRARSMHRAAKQIVELFDGRFPNKFSDVRSLPGIGKYTAGAILSIALDQRHPILEANTIRLFSRLLGYRGDPLDREGQQLLWQFADQILPRKKVGRFNQALMEVGSLVCLPHDPQCHACPVRGTCKAFESGLQATIPSHKKKISYESLHEAAVIVRRGNKVLLRRCRSDERWAGLWDFPRFEITSKGAANRQSELRRKTEELTGIDISLAQNITTIKHGVTRYRITLECYAARYVAHKHRQRRSTQKWVSWSALSDYPLSVTGRKISRLKGPIFATQQPKS